MKGDQELVARIAKRLMGHPASPGEEWAVRGEAEAICREHELVTKRDVAGNLLVTVNTQPRTRPLVLSAHMDHPGFRVLRPMLRGRWLLKFEGGVPDEFFREGLRVRLMPGSQLAVIEAAWGKPKHFVVRATGNAQRGWKPEFGVWEMEDFALRDGRIHGRACDDLIGCAATLATLIQLQRSRARVNVLGLLTRAEEIGFLGALAVASTHSLPRQALVVSLETSRELPPVEIGKGVIIRAGDRASVFDATATRFLAEVAGGLAKVDKTFAWQRALMGGGTCEATAFQEYGYQTAAICVALGNYHNCGAKKRLLPEYVALGDVAGMVYLLVNAARRMSEFETLTGRLRERLRKLALESGNRLKPK